MDPRNIIGSLKAAILVQALGWDVISPVVDQLSKAERNLIFKLQSKLGSISPALVESVAREFLEKATPPKQIESQSKDEGAGPSGNGLPERRDNNLKALQAIPPGCADSADPERAPPDDCPDHCAPSAPHCQRDHGTFTR